MYDDDLKPNSTSDIFIAPTHTSQGRSSEIDTKSSEISVRYRYVMIRNATDNDDSTAEGFFRGDIYVTQRNLNVSNTDPRLVWAYEEATGVIWALGDSFNLQTQLCKHHSIVV